MAGELAGLRPVQPGESLKERIRSAASVAEPGGRAIIGTAPWWGPASRIGAWAAAAVALATFAWSLRQGSGPLPVQEEGAPVSLVERPEAGEVEEETLWGAGEVAGIVDSGDGRPMWKLRYETIRRTAWSDGEGASRLLFEPEERIIFVPVSYN